MTNREIVKRLRGYARELQRSGSNLYRVRAYRRAADTIEEMRDSVEELFARDGVAGLQDLDGVGSHLAYTLSQLLQHGEFRTLRPAEGTVEPSQALTRLPGIGPMLAHRLSEKLGITTLDELEKAASSGRLTEVGLGANQLQGLLSALNVRREQRLFPELVEDEPTVEELLRIDEEFRASRTDSGADPMWQPMFRRDRNGWRFRARPCKHSLAYRQDKVGDWVSISFDNGTASGDCIVFTETRGEGRGKRVVRGRESASLEFHRSALEASA